MKLILVGVDLGNEQAWGVAGTFVATGDAVTATLGSVVASIDVSTGPSTNNNQLITTVWFSNH